MSTTTDRTQTHATFVIERDLPFPVERVWSAYADEDAKKAWFGVEADGWATNELVHDFRVGGQDVNAGTFNGDTESRFVSTYTDIVVNERIVLMYDMWFNNTHMSTSVQTIVLEATTDGTRLTLTEQGVHLDGQDTPQQREDGTRQLLDAMVATLR